MAKLTIEINGADILRDRLHDLSTLDMAKKVVQFHGAELHASAMRRAVFRGHFHNKRFIPPTGATRRSIRLQIRNGGLTARISSGTRYSGYLEVGTRYMLAQPFMRPALNEVEPQFIEDLRRLGK